MLHKNKQWMAGVIAHTNEENVQEWQKIAELTTKLNELTAGDASLLREYLLEVGTCSYFLSKARNCLDRALQKAESVTRQK